MPNILLSQLILNTFKIDQFLFLQKLIVRQLKNSCNHDELLITINRLGRSSSLSTIQLQQYTTSLNLTIDNLYCLLYDISRHFHRLEVMTIESDQDALFDSQILGKLTDIQKKNCHLDYICISRIYIELCFAR